MHFELSSLGIPLVLFALYWGFAPDLRRDLSLARVAVIIIPIALGIRYLAWRLVATVLPFEGDMLGQAWVWALFFVEALAFVEALVLYVIMMRVNCESAVADQRQQQLEAAGNWPSVDVFIPTYNEGLDVLEKTIIGARAIDYPNFKVYVLDDGRRSWLRDFCRAKNVEYLTRPDNSHAKAGNMNNGLAHSSGELVAIFDADFVPHRHFLRRTVGMFRQPDIGILQTPQHFYNRDPVQTNLLIQNDWPDEQRMFFDEMAASRDAWGAAFCCGSCSILRRPMLDEIGGIPTASITEDILTTLAGKRYGWRTAYLNERLSMGLAAESLEAFFVQRARWCQGGIQTLFLPEGPLGKGVRLRDRFFFFPWSWIIQYPVRMTAVIVPIVYFFFGLAPLHFTDLNDLFHYQAPALVANALTMNWLMKDKYKPILSNAIALFATFRLLPTVISSLIRPFGKAFHVTPKGAAINAGVDWISLSAIIAAFVLTAAGIVLNGVTPFGPLPTDSFFPIAATWAFINLIVLGLASLICFDAPRKRKEERFLVNRAVTVTDAQDARRSGAAMDVSLGGMFVQMPASGYAPGEAVAVELPMVGALRAKIVGVRSNGLALTFVWDEQGDDDCRDRLIAYLFSGDFSTEIPQATRKKTLWKHLIRRAFG